jgi:hypothetical protein
MAMEYLIFEVLGYIICFVLSVLFVRWVFKINDIITYQKRQYMMLRQIARKLGVDEGIIKDIDTKN